MDTNFQKIKSDPDPNVATTGSAMETAFNGNFDKIRANFLEQQAQIEELLYKELVINAFSGGGVFEKGKTITSVNFTWSYNKDVTSQAISDVSALNNTVRAYNLTGVNIITNRTYTLTASDGKVTKTRTTAVTFQDSRYWGVSEKTSLTAQEILSLLSGELATSFVQSKTFNCSGGKYFYLAWPSGFGTPSFKVGGLAFSAMEKVTIAAFTNASGASLPLDVWRVRDIQTGSNIKVEVL